MGYRRRQKSSRSTKSQKSKLPLIFLFAGILLLLAGLSYGLITGEKNTKSALAYSAGDVATEQPIFAVHEMGESPPIPFLPKGQPQPKIVVPEDSYSFGDIGLTEVVERSFIIRNDGKAPLTISRAYTTCGCTTAEVSASIIPPGKVATVKLVFDAGFHDAAGQTVRRGLIIENNDPLQPQAEIWIQASVRSY